MFLETQWHRSQLPQRDPLVCLEALPAALWNRRVLEESSRLDNEGDYALIKDFNLPQGDRIQLKGIAQGYRLLTRQGKRVYLIRRHKQYQDAGNN